MIRTKVISKALLAGPLALAVVACAPMTEERREYLAYLRLDHEEQFKAFRAECRNDGGRIVVYGTGRVGRDDIPHRGDPSFCVTPGSMKRFSTANTLDTLDADTTL